MKATVPYLTCYSLAMIYIYWITWALTCSFKCPMNQCNASSWQITGTLLKWDQYGLLNLSYSFNEKWFVSSISGLKLFMTIISPPLTSVFLWKINLYTFFVYSVIIWKHLVDCVSLDPKLAFHVYCLIFLPCFPRTWSKRNVSSMAVSIDARFPPSDLQIAY